jgi:outer membrane protein assembly factor BamA
MALANLEYDFGLVGASRAVVFVDAGSAWDEGTLFDQRIDVDMGAGVRLGEKGVSFYLARNVNRSDSDAKVLVRFQSTF